MPGPDNEKRPERMGPYWTESFGVDGMLLQPAMDPTNPNRPKVPIKPSAVRLFIRLLKAHAKSIERVLQQLVIGIGLTAVAPDGKGLRRAIGLPQDLAQVGGDFVVGKCLHSLA